MTERYLHFVAMVGSFRRGSYARAIADTLDELAPDDVSVTLLGSLGDLPHYDADLERMTFPYQATEMGAAIMDADALVIVTPEYNHSMPGALKNALDWLGRLPRRPLRGKSVAIQGVSTREVGGARALIHLRQVLVSLDAAVLNEPEIIVGEVAGKVCPDTGLLRDEGTRRRIVAQLTALAALARERSAHQLTADGATEFHR